MEANYHIIGLGGAGCNMLEYIYGQQNDFKYTCITSPKRKLDSNIRSLYYSNGIERHELPKGYSPNDSMIMPEEILATFKNNDRYILLCGLGGVVGSTLLSNIAQLLSEHNKTYRAILCTPFKFESESTQYLSKCVVDFFDGNRCFEIINYHALKDVNYNLPLNDFFERVNKHVYKIILNPTSESVCLSQGK